MKKIILLLLGFTLLFSSSLTTEQKIYKTVLNALFPNEKQLKIWIDDKSKAQIFKDIKIVKNIDNADLLILFKTKTVKTDKMIFIANHHILKTYSKNRLGGFYWQKGRPNLVFFKNNLKKFGIKLPENFKIYIENN